MGRVLAVTLASFQPSYRAGDHAIHRRERKPAFISGRDRREPDCRGLRIAAEDRLEQPGQLLARWPIGYLVSMSHHLPRIEHIHVNMHVDLVREAVQAIEFGEYGRRHVAQVVNAEMLDERLVEQMLFKRIGETYAAHHDVAVREGRIETRVQAE